MKRGRLLGLPLACTAGLALLGCGRMGFDEDRALPGEPPATLKLAYPAPGTYHAILNETALQLAPALAEGVKTFTISPAPPQGVTFDAATGALRGIPSEVSDRKRYVVTGHGAEAEVSAAFYLTALPGWKVTAMSDWADDNNGMGTCLATMAGGCTLRAAVQTASVAGGKRLLLLPEGTLTVSAEINGLEADLVIAGAGLGKTLIKAAAPRPGHRMMSVPAGRLVRLENATFQDFGPVDGGVVQVNRGRLEAYRVEFSRNASNSTGGVMCVDEGGQAHLEEVTFLDNEAVLNEGRGGALNASSPGTKITVVRSTAMHNRAIFGSFAWADSSATIELVNSTVASNVATEAAALAAYQAGIVVRSSTITGNTTPGNVTAALGIGLGVSSITLANTIVADNLSTADGAQRNCAVESSDASLISLGGNLFSNDADGCKLLMADRPRELNANLLLDVAARDNGGPTWTVALKAGSAAIDHGLGEHCPEEDQRGVKRTRGAADTCDAGAFELE